MFLYKTERLFLNVYFRLDSIGENSFYLTDDLFCVSWILRYYRLAEMAWNAWVDSKDSLTYPISTSVLSFVSNFTPTEILFWSKGTVGCSLNDYSCCDNRCEFCKASNCIFDDSLVWISLSLNLSWVSLDTSDFDRFSIWWSWLWFFNILTSSMKGLSCVWVW